MYLRMNAFHASLTTYVPSSLQLVMIEIVENLPQQQRLASSQWLLWPCMQQYQTYTQMTKKSIANAGKICHVILRH